MTDEKLKPADRQAIGETIWRDALSDRSGFDHGDIDDDIWLEIYEAIADAAINTITAWNTRADDGARLKNLLRECKRAVFELCEDTEDSEYKNRAAQIEAKQIRNAFGEWFRSEIQPVLDNAEPARADGWQPISQFPKPDKVVFYDLWCIEADAPAAGMDWENPIGKVVTRRHWSKDYGWFGNQFKERVPNGHAPDLIPVAFRLSPPDCPIEIIAAETGLPLPAPPTPIQDEQ